VPRRARARRVYINSKIGQTRKPAMKKSIKNYQKPLYQEPFWMSQENPPPKECKKTPSAKTFLKEYKTGGRNLCRARAHMHKNIKTCVVRCRNHAKNGF